jgi:DNA-binding MarR family transcriptional regulator
LGRNGGQTVPDLARARRTSRQNIQIVVNRLKSQGLAEFVRNPNHKKSSLVQLTQKGRSLAERIQDAEARLLSYVLTDLSQDELAVTTRCLQRLRQALEIEAAPVNGNEHAPSRTAQEYHPMLARDNEPARSLENDKGVQPDENAFPVNLL